MYNIFNLFPALGYCIILRNVLTMGHEKKTAGTKKMPLFYFVWTEEHKLKRMILMFYLYYQMVIPENRPLHEKIAIK